MQIAPYPVSRQTSSWERVSRRGDDGAPDGRNIWNEIDLLAASVRFVERLLEELTRAVHAHAIGRVAKVEEPVEHLQNDIGRERELSSVKIILAAACSAPAGG